MSNRYREKVRKLLALAESNNPYEAERALSQAKKIMAKYNIKSHDTEITTVKSSNVHRRFLKDYEVHMISCINFVSGCEAFSKSTHHDDGKTVTDIYFVGLASDANMAGYSLDILHTQVRQFQLKMKEKGHTAPERNRASMAWVIAACEKLNQFFDYKKVPDNVKNYYNQESENYNESEYKESKTLDDSKDTEILNYGYYEGHKALLNKAASHQKNDKIA